MFAIFGLFALLLTNDKLFVLGQQKLTQKNELICERNGNIPSFQVTLSLFRFWVGFVPESKTKIALKSLPHTFPPSKKLHYSN